MIRTPDREPLQPLLAALLDAAREPIFALDGNGTILLANAAAAARLGQARPHLRGKPFATLLDLKDRRAFRRVFAQVDIEPVELEASLAGAGRETLVLRELPGQQSRHVAVTIGAGDGRAPRPSSREDDRREIQVMHEFLRNAAHQLRTPLTAIATAIEVLQAGAKESPAERDRFLAHIDEHARRLIRLARGLLVLARAQSGEPIRLDFVRIAPVLEELARQASPAAGVELRVDCEPDVEALADRDLAHEAIAALVDNAVEHTRAGTVLLTAAATNGQVAISVVDEGGGILPEHRERIFEPFYRPTAAGDGHGLGLAIAVQAVQAMSGELTAEDSEGGARFTIRLPSATKRQ